MIISINAILQILKGEPPQLEKILSKISKERAMRLPNM